MAILSVKLDLVAGIWQSIGAIGFVLDADRQTTLELTNADALPVGTIDAVMVVRPPHIQVCPKPATGNWYVRCAAVDSSIVYTAI